MAFLTEPEPTRGVVLPAVDGIARIVAPNPGPMTYHGTNTWLIDSDDGFSVLDPGPDDATHVRAILDATGGRVARILLSHTHLDHLGAVPALRVATRAPVFGFHRPQEPGFAPDVGLHDGDEVAGWTALHTPGHATDHLVFARADGVVFSADHVMSWSSTVVSPPHGDMTDYFASLHRLLARDDRLYLPGHGPPLHDPMQLAQDLLNHRLQREAAIVTALEGGPKASEELVAVLYAQVNPALHRAAERNVVAHLGKLAREGRAVQDGAAWRLP
jgi:glyoxylase-like metal-dependent hydrolase (beta-lactamase superfamily II)